MHIIQLKTQSPILTIQSTKMVLSCSREVVKVAPVEASGEAWSSHSIQSGGEHVLEVSCLDILRMISIAKVLMFTEPMRMIACIGLQIK